MVEGKRRHQAITPTYLGNHYTVVRRTSNGAYVLKDTDGEILDRRVPLDQIKVLKGPRLSDKDDEMIFTVEKIVAHEERIDGHYYLVKWKNWDDTYNSWEPAHNILDEKIIRAYHEKEVIASKKANVKPTATKHTTTHTHSKSKAHTTKTKN